MEERANKLRVMQICRFCLDEKGPFTSMYEKDVRDGRQSTPLPLQIMACVAIEVFANDGMPQMICNSCRTQTIGAYNFKTTCKKSDDALKLFLATGTLTKPSSKPVRVVPSAAGAVQQKKRVIEPPPAPVELKKPKIEYELVQYDEQENEPEEISEGHLVEEEQEGDSPTEYTEDEEFEEAAPQTSKVPQVETDVFPCTSCERTFPLKQLLDLHMKNHTRERSFTCEECGRKFFTKYDLAKHTQTHSEEKPFSCVICNKQFSRESLLHRHEKIHVDVPKYLCTQCDRTFLTKDDLDQHAEKHKKKRPYTCRICKKCFVFKQGLERHEATHSDEKPHKCNYCEASFTSPIKLMRHITSHAGLRPYPCKLCGRTFLLSHHLTRHLRSHYATKSPVVEPVGQHKCDVCSMSFRRKDSLINHSAIHSMVNLKCVICNTAFMNAKQVKDHITTHLAGLPYPCDRCDYSFDTQDQLEEHELKHAEMEYEEEIEQEVHDEAAQQQIQVEFEDEDDEDIQEEVAEFTITNELDENPQVVRRPARRTKIKNYAQFLKDELGSDIEDDLISPEKDALIEEPSTAPTSPVSPQEPTIKPIVRTEGTKVYQRKPSEKTRATLDLPPQTSSPHPSTQQLNLDGLDLNHQTVKDLTNRQFLDMKVGDKTVRVHKVMMTKAEIQAMAKEGKIEMKGETIILKKTQPNVYTKPAKAITIENIIDEPRQLTPQKPPITKTYAKRPAPVQPADVEH